MMKTISNPFEFEAANNLTDQDIIDFYIEDYNYSRFIRSTKNIFLVGERGSGKTMTLLYNSFPIQYKISKEQRIEPNYDKIGIHIPCNTPLFHKKEYLLLREEHKRYIICEHFLVLCILFHIAKTLSGIDDVVKDLNDLDDSVYDSIKYAWGIDKNLSKKNFFNDIKNFVNKELRSTQIKLNSINENFYESSYSFASLLLPLFEFLRNINSLSKSHFMIMIDDAHDMNEYQIRILNSWIAYRDHSIFSFKVASTRLIDADKQTNGGGCILEGHDYLTVEMGGELYNKDSDFYKFARKIIETRLQRCGINVPPEEFFPTNKDFIKGIEQAKVEAKAIAESKFGKNATCKIDEYVGRYHRAIYYRNRPPKANTPPYSGFDTLVDISTGIVRNLLDPCYWMFDKIVNDKEVDISNIKNITSSIQNSVIRQRSADLWNILRSGLDKIIPNCSKTQSDDIFKMFEKIVSLFKKRLMSDISEPRAIVFALTGEKEYAEEYAHIKSLIDISVKAQLLYFRVSSGKQLGSKIVYYVPNRILLPDRGLDVKGQASNVSIRVEDLYKAIKYNEELPFFKDEQNQKQSNEGLQLSLQYE